MKRFLAITLIALAAMLSGSLVNKASAQARVDVSYQNFYDELSPYGQWIDYPDYGYVWVPDEGRDFRPYSSGGRWVWSDDYEWMWVSDYSWGWAPFHYGRWFEDPRYGWMWMPGYEWAPAWVAWRDGGDYYGWAPLRPGININIGFSMGSYNPPVDYWCFAPRRYITSNRINSYCVDRSRNVTIINNTTIINNYSRRTNNIFVTGPRRSEAERYAGRITPVRFRESSRPGRDEYRNNRVSIYRPQVRNDDSRRFAPRSYNRYDNNNGNGVRNGNTPDRRNVFDRNSNDNDRRGNDARAADRSNNNDNRNNLPEHRNVFDRNNGSSNNNNNDSRGNNGRVADRGNNNDNGNNLPERRNVFDRNNRNNNNNDQPGNRDRTVRPSAPVDNNRTIETPGRRDVFDRNNSNDRNATDNRRMDRSDRSAERRNIESRPPATNTQPERRNVFDRPAQQQQQPRMERQQQPQQQPQRMERSQQPERRSAPESRSGNDNGGRRNVFDRRGN